MRAYRLREIFYTSTFFGEVGPENYDFIGDHARFDDEMQRLKMILGVAENPDPLQENVSSIRLDGYKQFKQSILGDPTTLGKLKQLLADDLDFYEKHAGR